MIAESKDRHSSAIAAVPSSLTELVLARAPGRQVDRPNG